jgi:hypothetical protein
MESMGAAQQMTFSWLATLAALERRTLAGQTTSPGALLTLKNRQGPIECDCSAIEAPLSGVWCDLWFVQAARKFGNVGEREQSQSLGEVDRFVLHWMLREKRFYSGRTG